MIETNLILIGAGGHSRSCIDVIEQEGKYGIGGLVGLINQLGSSHFGYEVIATDSGLSELVERFPYALITLGQIQTPELRMRLFEQSIVAGFVLPTIIAPTAYVSPHATLGAGTIVMHGVVINAGASVGDNCIINSQSLIEHDSKVADHCHISTGAILNGDTSIGAGTFVGSGVIIKEGVSVGTNSVLGMGLTVRHNLLDNSNFMGGATS